MGKIKEHYHHQIENAMSIQEESKYSIELHGEAHALYYGRNKQYHGARLMNLSDGDMRFKENCERLLMALNNFNTMLQALKGADKLLKIYSGHSEPSLNENGVAADIWKQIKQAIYKAETT